jgi:sigma-B regulation protein RsbU (phosphoserine phosphatase)
MLRNKSLAYKLSFSMLSAVLFSVLLILFVNYQVSKKLILKETEERAFHLSQSVVHNIDSMLLSAQKIPGYLAYMFEHSPIEEERLHYFLKVAVETNDEVFGSSIAFEPNSFVEDLVFYAPYYFKNEGNVEYKDLAGSTYNYFEKDWYKLPKQKGALWSEPYFDKGGGDIMMSTYSVPFYHDINNKKEFWGVVTADISLNWLESLMGKLRIYQNGYAFLLSETGVILVHPQAELVLNHTIFSLAEKYKLPELTRIGNEMIAGKTGFIPYKSLSLNGKSRLYYAPLPDTNWSIGIVFPDKELFADLNKLAAWLLILGASSLVALFILIVIIARNITNPLRGLAIATQRVGSGDFNVKLPQSDSNDEISQLTASFTSMQEHLNNYIRDLKETTTAKERIESELKIAHDIQQGIIPKVFPAFPRRNDIDVYAVLDPAREVGGDLYDFFFIEKNLMAFAIGDVSGKGVPASLFMAITVTLLRAKAQKGLKVNEIVESINFELCRDNSRFMFVTFFLGIIDLETGEISYCNAGHNYPYVLSQRGELQCLEQTHGAPLGLYEKTAYKSTSFHLKQGENIVLYTDGITEAMDSNGELFGEEGFEQGLRALPVDILAKEQVTELIDKTRSFTMGAQQSDDITMLILSGL